MVRRIAVAAAVALSMATGAFADFSYEQTTKLTGGMMVDMMKVAGAFSRQARQAREPVRTSVLVKGDRMAHASPTSTQIIDLGRETITTINLENRTYSVMTFAQMAQAMARMEAKLRKERGQGSGEITAKPSIQETGQRRQVAGYDTHQVILKVEMEGTDSRTGQPGTFMVVTSDMWLAEVPGYGEVRHFYRRMAQKMDWAPGQGMFAAQPAGSKGMAELMRETAKLDGVPVYQETRMGFGGTVPPGQQAAGQPAQTPPPPPPQEQQQAQAEQPSVGGALGRLGGRLGGLGGFGRKKKQKQQEEQQPASTQGSQSAGGAPPGASGSLMEMTSELSGFSTAPIDPAKFEVPAGFRQVESELLKQMER
ncbi:MAG: hypothetical protein ABSD56_04350 [Bryobacteraceae bacterium]